MMHDFTSLGKILIIAGVSIAIVGILIIAAGRIPNIGRLPGDIYIQRKNFTFYFPLATSVIISIVLSVLFWLIFRRR